MRVGRFRLGLLVGLGIGFVAGTASGRERYDQMDAAARRLAAVSRRAINSGVARSAGERMGAVGNGVLGKLARPAPAEAEQPGLTPYPESERPRSSF